MMAELYITIGRQFGSGGRENGKKVAEALGIPYYDKELLAVAAQESGLSHEFLQSYDERPTNSFLYSLVMGQHHLSTGMPGSTVEQMAANAQREAVLSVADKGSCVIVGRCADYILRDHPRTVNIFIAAGRAERIERLCRLHGIAPGEAESLMDRTDARRAAYYNYYSSGTWGMAETYDLCIDSSVLGIDGTTGFVLEFVERKLGVKP